MSKKSKEKKEIIKDEIEDKNEKEEKEKEEENIEEEEEDTAATIFIKNLNFKTTEEDLKKHFSKVFYI